MSTFFDPATIRRLADSGDKFFAGAAWILDQQDAARIDTTDYDNEWQKVVPIFSPEEHAARLRYRKRKAAQAAEGDWDWDSLDA